MTTWRDGVGREVWERGSGGRGHIYTYGQFILKVKVTQLCPTLCNPKDYIESMEFFRPG